MRISDWSADVCSSDLVFSAGRTDAGVHAIAMRAHVDIEKPLTPFKLTEGLNAQLRPAPIAIVGCEIVPDDWHARFACIRRSSEYPHVHNPAPPTRDKGLSGQVAQTQATDPLHPRERQPDGTHP